MIREFMIPVERVVRTLPAPHARKMRMREELYSLLQDRFDELKKKAKIPVEDEGPHPALMQQAIAAFGDPDIVRAQLLSAIPVRVRWAHRLDRIATGGEDPLTLRGAVRTGMFAAILLAGWLMVSFAVLWMITGKAMFLQIWPVLATLPVFTGVQAAGQLYFGKLAIGALAKNRFARVALIAMGSSLLLSSASLLLYLIASPHYLLSTGWHHVLFLAPVSGLLFLLVCQLADREQHESQLWLELDLSGPRS